jgi:hypothetical protein
MGVGEDGAEAIGGAFDVAQGGLDELFAVAPAHNITWLEIKMLRAQASRADNREAIAIELIYGELCIATTIVTAKDEDRYQ